MEITRAVSQSANSPVEGAATFNQAGIPEAGPPVAGLPAFCRVTGLMRPETGSNIRFEVWLPSQEWNGRLHGVGVGGLAGWIDFATLGSAVKGGQVGVATDTGHRGGPDESAWAKGRPELVRDYAWRAIHVSTVAAKTLTKAFYGKEPDRSYFVGCSGGGRQGLMEASRYPEDYDGIIVGAPAADFMGWALNRVHLFQAQMPAGAAIRPEQALLLQSEVIAQCDAPDGQRDGLVEDPRQCKLDVSKLSCSASKSPHCFTNPQLATLRKIYDGARDSSGRLLSPPLLPSGGETSSTMAPFGWDAFVFRRQGERTLLDRLSEGLLLNLSSMPIAPLETFNFDKDSARLRASLEADLNPSTNLSAFFARGGKMILWQGWADAAIAPEMILDYNAAMLRQSGPTAAASSRLYMIPGVQHCSGGPGPSSFGGLGGPDAGETSDRSMIVALQDWVEGRRGPPESVVGRRVSASPPTVRLPAAERQRLLCAWPKKAVLRKGADPDKAASYTCEPRTAS